MNPGKRLRELRIERWVLIDDKTGKKRVVNGKKATKEYIAEFAGITPKTLTEIEDGVTKLPARTIIEAIISILDKFKVIDWATKQSILTAYGYKFIITPPTQLEGSLAKENWEKANSKIRYPAYLVDIIHRLWAWNKYAPRLLGLTSTDIRLSQFSQIDILDVLFKLAPRYVEIINKDEYISGLIYTLKIQFQPYMGESWLNEWIENAQNRYPEFKKFWLSIPESSISSSAAMGNQIPIELRVKSEPDIMKFQLTAVGFANDPRFTVVQWIPVDDVATFKCLLWQKLETS